MRDRELYNLSRSTHQCLLTAPFAEIESEAEEFGFLLCFNASVLIFIASIEAIEVYPRPSTCIELYLLSIIPDIPCIQRMKNAPGRCIDPANF